MKLYRPPVQDVTLWRFKAVFPRGLYTTCQKWLCRICSCLAKCGSWSSAPRLGRYNRGSVSAVASWLERWCWPALLQGCRLQDGQPRLALSFLLCAGAQSITVPAALGEQGCLVGKQKGEEVGESVRRSPWWKTCDSFVKAATDIGISPLFYRSCAWRYFRMNWTECLEVCKLCWALR